MSMTLSATIAETRLGQRTGGIAGLHYSYQQQKGMPQPPIGRKSEQQSLIDTEHLGQHNHSGVFAN